MDIGTTGRGARHLGAGTVRGILILTAMIAALTLDGLPVQAGPLDGEWGQFAIPGMPARTSFVLVLDTTRDRLIAFGGDPGPMQDTWTLSLATPGSEWQSLNAGGSAPSARYGHAAIYDPLGDRVILYGGYGAGGMKNDVWALTLSGTPQWTQLTTTGTSPTGRQDVAAVYDAALNRMVIFGGYRANSTFTNETWALSLGGTPTWSAVPVSGSAPSVRGVMQSALDVTRNRLVIFGGWNGVSYLGDTWALGLEAGSSWTRITTSQLPPPRREGVAVYDAGSDRIVMFGGTNGALMDDCWQLSLSGTPEWDALALTGPGPSPRAGARAVYDAVRHRMLVCSGYDGDYRADTRALSLDPGPMSWSLVEDHFLGIPPRRDVAAVYDRDDRDMLIFGGTGGGGDLNDTWRLSLDTAKPQWEPVYADGPPPGPRHGHRAVWDPTRRRMLMIGGYTLGYDNDVWELDMDPTPTWHPVATLGTRPAGRMLFGLALDPVRDRLIMFGGHSGFGVPGGVYRNDVWELPLSGPSALTWAPVAVSGTPPSGRWVYAMRYDPPRDRMVIFGGTTVSDRTNEVWTLELSGGPHWVQLTPPGPAPSARSDHMMVYDQFNDRMVTFGGYDGGFRNDAWALRLDGPPQWTLLSPIGGTPIARDIIDGVYDPVAGSMIVFGGWSGSGLLADTWALNWGSPPTPTEASLIESHVESDRVRLAWHVRDAVAVRAVVERRVGSAAWSSMGAPVVDGGEIMRFEDTDVAAGTHYTYRLRLNANGEETLTAETEIEVPTGNTLALAGAQPNPTQGGPLNVSFSLARASDGRLELMDLAGRRVASRELRGLAPGQHRIVFSEASRAEPGVYLMRLVTKERTLTAKALVTR